MSSTSCWGLISTSGHDKCLMPQTCDWILYILSSDQEETSRKSNNDVILQSIQEDLRESLPITATTETEIVLSPKVGPVSSYHKSSDTEIFTVITLKFEQGGFTVVCPTDEEGVANSVDPDQTAPLEQSDLGLHCLPRPVCPKSLEHYSRSFREIHFCKTTLKCSCISELKKNNKKKHEKLRLLTSGFSRAFKNRGPKLRSVPMKYVCSKTFLQLGILYVSHERTDIRKTRNFKRLSTQAFSRTITTIM